MICLGKGRIKGKREDDSKEYNLKQSIAGKLCIKM